MNLSHPTTLNPEYNSMKNRKVKVNQAAATLYRLFNVDFNFLETVSVDKNVGIIGEIDT